MFRLNGTREPDKDEGYRKNEEDAVSGSPGEGVGSGTRAANAIPGDPRGRRRDAGPPSSPGDVGSGRRAASEVGDMVSRERGSVGEPKGIGESPSSGKPSNALVPDVSPSRW